MFFILFLKWYLYSILHMYLWYSLKLIENYILWNDGIFKHARYGETWFKVIRIDKQRSEDWLFPYLNGSAMKCFFWLWHSVYTGVICHNIFVIISSGNDLLPVWCQAITWAKLTCCQMSPQEQSSFPLDSIPDSKVHGANMGPTWGRQAPGGSHVGPMNLAIWDILWLEWNFHGS